MSIKHKLQFKLIGISLVLSIFWSMNRRIGQIPNFGLMAAPDVKSADHQRYNTSSYGRLSNFMLKCQHRVVSILS